MINLKIIFLIFFLYTSSFSLAQIEAKFDALGAIFGQSAVKAEYLINDDFGVELSYNFRYGKPILLNDEAIKQHGGGLKLEARYYLSSFDYNDGYYIGVYLRKQSLFNDYEDTYYSYDIEQSIDYTYTVNEKFMSIGLLLGYKTFFDSGITIESGLGLGRFMSYDVTDDIRDDGYETYNTYDSSDEIDFIFTFAFGYRFEFNNKKTSSTPEEF